MDFPRLKDANFKDKRVLIRTGFDVPVDKDGNIEDDARIRISVPTIRNILKDGAKQIIVCFHMGRPKGKEERYKADKAAQRLSELLDMPVTKVDSYTTQGNDDKIIVLENLRFDRREKSKEESERDKFGKELASLADIFVQDAFSNCHHEHASMTSIPKFLPGVAGLSVEKELDAINGVLENPKRPFVSIIGGLKAEKLNVVKNLLPKVDKILLGGALAFTVLKGLGYDVGASKIDLEGLKSDELLSVVKDEPKILLPTDAAIADRFLDDAKKKIVSITDIDDGWMALDIGTDTIAKYVSVLKGAKTITWNGPIGVFEFENFAQGTKEIAKAIAKSDAISIIGGGDSAKAVRKLGFADGVTHISTGGGASLYVLEGKRLPAIVALRL